MSQNKSSKEYPLIAVAIPCYNEAITIEKVVSDFRQVLPKADVFVFDNNSNDGSSHLAEQAGAHVVKVCNQGKGHVLQAIFDGILADALVLVDGDDTYEAEEVHRLIEPVISDGVDMVVGNRLKSATDENMRAHRHIGNRLIVWSINRMFGTQYQDILSGYRVFSRRFVERVPLLTPGFEIETDKEKIYLLIDADYQCNEDFGYICSEESEDFEAYYGCEIVSIEFIDDGDYNPNVQIEMIKSMQSYADVLDCAFINVKFKQSTLQFAVYNKHNGCYGHCVEFIRIPK